MSSSSSLQSQGDVLDRMSYIVQNTDRTCMITAVMFVIGNILRTIYHSETNNEHFNKIFDPRIIQDNFIIMNDYKNLSNFASFMLAFCWLLLSIPIIRLVLILSQNMTRNVLLHMTIIITALVCSYVAFISTMLSIGLMNAHCLLAEKFNLDMWTTYNQYDNLGWRTLELLDITTWGFLTWINSVVYLCLAVIFGLFGIAIYIQHYHIRQLRKQNLNIPNQLIDLAVSFRPWLSVAQFYLCLLCFLDFVCELLRYKNYDEFSMFIHIIQNLNRLLFFPIWLVYMGYHIKRIDEQQQHRNNANGTANSNNNSASPQQQQQYKQTAGNEYDGEDINQLEMTETSPQTKTQQNNVVYGNVDNNDNTDRNNNNSGVVGGLDNGNGGEVNVLPLDDVDDFVGAGNSGNNNSSEPTSMQLT